MQTMFIKSFSKGQVTIPKEIREALGIGEDFWLKISLTEGKIIAEPVNEVLDKARYQKDLLSIKDTWDLGPEIKQNRKQVDAQIAKRSL